jgi:hypothetical protein
LRVIAKPNGVQFDFESQRNFELRVSWPVYNVRPINCESIRTRRRQILERDFAHDARRISRPIAHRLFAGKERAFSDRAGYDGEEENGREKDYARDRIAPLASFHSQWNRSVGKYRADSNHLPRKHVSQRRYSSCVFHD